MATTKLKFRFTDDSLKKVAPPARGRIYLKDAEVRGFVLDVTSSGAKTFRLAVKVDGVSRRLYVDQFTGDNTKAARAKAEILRGKLRAGDPIDLSAGGRLGGPTLEEFFERWLDEHAKPHRPGTWRHDEQLFVSHIKERLGHRPLQSIKAQHIRELHAWIAAQTRDKGTVPGPQKGAAAGQRTANRMLQLVSILFNCARQWGAYADENPTVGVRRFKEPKRERYLQQDEAGRFFATLADRGTAKDPGTPQDARDFILLGLFTGARRSNLMAMSWADIDLEAALWTIPGTETKTARAYHIPLVPPAVAVLQERAVRRVEGCPWVFPANSTSGHLVSFQKQWDQFRQRAGLPDLRFHDLRHTLASWQASAGTSLAIIGKGLGHSSPNTTSRYAHINVDPVRASMDRAAGDMLRAAGAAAAPKRLPAGGRKRGGVK